MQWIGKAVGGLLGFAAAGPVGSVFGVLFGQGVDRRYAARFGTGGMDAVSSPVRQFFFEVSFEVMGHIAKSDGRVSEAEIRAARRIMQAMQLAPVQIRHAIEHFTLGKAGSYPLTGRISELQRRIGEQRDLARMFVELQMKAALASGTIGGIKRQLLWRVAASLGMGRAEFAHVEALLRAEHFRETAAGVSRMNRADADYRLLGLSSGASNQAIKLAYRRLMSRHHPDKLLANGASSARVVAAAHRTQEIRAAYERIKAERAFK